MRDKSDTGGGVVARIDFMLTAALASSILDEIEAGVIIVGTDGMILYANRSAEDLVGLPQHRLMRQPIETLVPATQRDQHERWRAAFTAGPGPRTRWMGRDLDIHLMRADGSELPVRIGLSRMMTADYGQIVVATITPAETG